jgi:hypothetical protein
MGKKRPSKITLLKCIYPRVTKVAQFEPASFDDAVDIVAYCNDKIVAAGRDNTDEFCFLDVRIAGETRIITKAEQKDYPGNDPNIVAKLQEYLDQENQGNTGSAQSRGKTKNGRYYD